MAAPLRALATFSPSRNDCGNEDGKPQEDAQRQHFAKRRRNLESIDWQNELGTAKQEEHGTDERERG